MIMIYLVYLKKKDMLLVFYLIIIFFLESAQTWLAAGAMLDSKFKKEVQLEQGEMTARKVEVIARDIFHSILKKNSFYAYYWH